MKANLAKLLLSAAMTQLFLISAMADIRVLESNVSAYPVGAEISDYRKIDLPPDGQIRILDLTNNETRLLKGSKARSMRDIPIGSSRGPTEPTRP